MGIVKIRSNNVIVICDYHFIHKSKIVMNHIENDSLSRYNSVLPVWVGLQKSFQASTQTSCHEKIKVNISLVSNSKSHKFLAFSA